MKNKLFYSLIVFLLLNSTTNFAKDPPKPKPEKSNQAVKKPDKKAANDKEETIKDTTKEADAKKIADKKEKEEKEKKAEAKKAADKNAKEEIQKTNYLYGGIGSLLGAILGLIIGFFMAKRTKKEVPSNGNELAESQKRIAALEGQLQQQASEIQRLTADNTALRQAQAKPITVPTPVTPIQQKLAEQQIPITKSSIFYTRTLNGSAFNVLDLRPTPDLFKITLQIDIKENIISGSFEVNLSYAYNEFFPSYNFMLQGCDFQGGIIPSTQSRITRQTSGVLVPTQDGKLNITQKTKIWLQ